MMEFLLRFWNNKWYASLLAGLLLGLSFPPFPFSWLIIPAFVLLFRLCDLCQGYRELAVTAFAGFLLWNVIGTYWLTFATIAGGVAAILANSVLMTLPLALMKWLRHRFGVSPVTVLLQAAVWVSFEFAHHNWDLAWPWLTLANAFSTSVAAVQYISLTGMLGASFWLVASASLIYFAVLDPLRRRMAAAAGATLLPVLISLGMYYGQEFNSDETLEIAVIQPNYDSYQDYGGYDDPYTPLQNLLGYTEEIITSETQVVLWPENALQTTLEQNHTGRADRLIREHVDRWQMPLVTGSAFIRFYDGNENRPRVYRGGRDRNRPFNIYNSALGFYPDRNEPVFYGKKRLVPFVERIPFVETLDLLDVPDLVNWGSISGYGKGNRRTQFELNGARLPALVCYDSIYPNMVRRFVNDGASMITVITNDGWWGRTSGHIQHYDYARLRAIENRRMVLRSANNGQSGVIDARGNVLIRTEYWTRDRFTYQVPVYERTTLYTRYGDWFPWLNLLAVLGVFGLLVRERVQRRRGRKQQRHGHTV